MVKACKEVFFLIGDAQPKVRFGLRKWLEQQDGWKVIGEAEDAQALLEQVHLGCPTLVLLDWELPGMDARDLLITIRHVCPHMRVIFMSGKNELREMALEAGADVFAYKADPPKKLLGMIQDLVNQ